MDTFIVRIYRRIADSSRSAAGTVEHVETGQRVGFTGVKELIERLFGTTTTAGDAACVRAGETIDGESQ